MRTAPARRARQPAARAAASRARRALRCRGSRDRAAPVCERRERRSGAEKDGARLSFGPCPASEKLQDSAGGFSHSTSRCQRPVTVRNTRTRVWLRVHRRTRVRQPALSVRYCTATCARSRAPPALRHALHGLAPASLRELCHEHLLTQAQPRKVFAGAAAAAARAAAARALPQQPQQQRWLRPRHNAAHAPGAGQATVLRAGAGARSARRSDGA